MKKIFTFVLAAVIALTFSAVTFAEEAAAPAPDKAAAAEKKVEKKAPKKAKKAKKAEKKDAAAPAEAAPAAPAPAK